MGLMTSLKKVKVNWGCILSTGVIVLLFLIVPVSHPSSIDETPIVIFGKPLEWAVIYKDEQTQRWKVAVDLWCGVSDVVTISGVALIVLGIFRRRAPLAVQAFAWMLLISLIDAHTEVSGLWNDYAYMGIPFSFICITRYYHTSIWGFHVNGPGLCMNLGVLEWEFYVDVIICYMIWLGGVWLAKKVYKKCVERKGETSDELKR